MNFEKLKRKYDRQYKLNLLIGTTLLVVGVITITNKVFIAVCLILMGILLAVMAKKNNIRNNAETNKITSIEEFNKSMKKSLLDMPEFSLYISDKYVVSELRGLKVFVLKEMKKFEVGIAGDKKKSLFLTDKNGIRHEIAFTVKGDKRQKSFDQSYFKIKDIFDNKKYK